MAKRNFIPLVPSGTINADASVAQLEQDVLAMDAKVGELAEDIGDTEQEINQLKSEIDEIADTETVTETWGLYFDGFEFKPGYYDNKFGWGENANYNSFYMTADRDYTIYVPTPIAADYLSIGVYHDSVAGGNSEGRYRKSEDNLPTEESPLTVSKGKIIVISITTTVIAFNIQATSSKKVTIADTAMDESYATFATKHAGIATKSASNIVVTLNDKMRFLIYKYNEAGIREVNVWRIAEGALKVSEGNFHSLWTRADVDGVVRIVGEDDFVGGYHGDETQTSLKVFVDGIEYQESDSFHNLEFDEMVIYCESNVYHCNTSSTPDVVAFTRKKTLTLNRDGCYISNYWVAQEALSLICAYMGMLSIDRYTDSGFTTELLHGYYTNHDFTYRDNSTALSNETDLTEVVFHTRYGDIGISIDNVETPATYYGNVTNYNNASDKRLKAYLAPIYNDTGVSIQADDVIKARARFFIP